MKSAAPHPSSAQYALGPSLSRCSSVAGSRIFAVAPRDRPNAVGRPSPPALSRTLQIGRPLTRNCEIEVYAAGSKASRKTFRVHSSASDGTETPSKRPVLALNADADSNCLGMARN